MKKILLLFSILFATSIGVFAQTDSISSKNPYYGSVKTIYETKHILKSDTTIDTKDFSESDFLALEEDLSLVDSSVIKFNENELVEVSQNFCLNLEKTANISPCFITTQRYDDNNKWLSSEVINLTGDGDTSTYTVLTATKEGLPIRAEAKNTKGEVTEYNYYEFNDKGFIAKLVVEKIVYNYKFEVTREYEENGFRMKNYHIKRLKLTDGEYIIQSESSTIYEYLEFDENGNWMKYRGINQDGTISYAYRTYIYNE